MKEKSRIYFVFFRDVVNGFWGFKVLKQLVHIYRLYLVEERKKKPQEGCFTDFTWSSLTFF